MQTTSLTTLRQWQRNGQLVEAEQELRLLLATPGEDSQEAAAMALLGSLLCQQGRQEEGEVWLTQAMTARAVLDSEGLADLGGGFLLHNRLEQAQSLLQEALAKNPACGVCQGRLGMVYFKRKQLAPALHHLQQAVTLLPQAHALHFNLARVYHALGRLDEALGHLTLGEAGLPLPADLAMIRLEIWLILGRSGEAEQWLHKKRQQEGDTAANLVLQATVFAASNRHEEAAWVVRQGLERQPDNEDLLACAAEVAGNRGLFLEKYHYLVKLCQLLPAEPRWWIETANLASLRLEDHVALEAASKAMELTTHQQGKVRAAALTAMGQVATDQEHYEQGESCYLQALQTAPQFLPAHLGLGRLLMQVGRIDEAVAHYETVSQISPTAAFSGLVHARRFPEGVATLEKMEQAARRPSLEGPVKSHILFDLAIAWENRGDYDKAFALAMEANTASRPFLSYQADEYSRKINRILQRFSPAFLTGAKTGLATPLPVFVLGMPRSGTTLVEQIIASHPLAFGAGELPLIPTVISRLNAWEKHVGSGREYPECLDTLTQPMLERMASRVLVDLQRQAPQAQRIVDKLPHNFENIGLIHLLFPQATILHCVRDGRDIGVSNFFTDYQAKYGGMGFAYDLQDLGRHIADYQRLMDHWHQVLPGRILDVSYEALVDQPEVEARKIFAHLGLPWDARVLDFPDLKRPVKTASVWQVRQPIYRTSKARWSHYAHHLSPLLAALEQGRQSATLPPALTAAPNQDLFLEGMELLKQGRWQSAEGCFRRLLQNNPNHAAGHHFLGAALYQQGHFRWAVERMRRSVRLHSGHASWWRNLAMVHQALHQVEEAQEALQTAITLESAHAG